MGRSSRAAARHDADSIVFEIVESSRCPWVSKTHTREEAPMSTAVISPADLAELCKSGKPIDLIDVRTPVEFREVHLTIARNIPLDQLDASAILTSRKGDVSGPLYFVCRSGSRGRQACEKLFKAG